MLSNAEWENFIARDFKWSKWCLEHFKDKIRNYFHYRKLNLDKYIYSIIRVKSEGLSKELYLRIKDEESDFYSIAKSFSEGIEKNSGGIIGPVNLEKPHPLIANLLKVSHENQLWPPKKINDWWVLIRLEEKIEATLNDNLEHQLAIELGNSYLLENI